MRLSILPLLAILAAPAAANTPCGGDFRAFVNTMKAEALAQGRAPATVDAFFRNVAQDQRVLRADRSQTMFRRDFTDFARSLISRNRMDNAARLGTQHAALFDRARREYGVPRGILLAFWAFETDFGAVQGDYNTRDALVTLSHDCRRPALFRPHVFAAIALQERGQFDPQRTKGAWAGEIGMVQMLPRDILERGVDGDGDGRVDLVNSVPDAILSGARMLRDLGWRAGEPWLHEIVLPDGLDWARTGLHSELTVAEWQRMGVRPRQGSLGPANMRASVLLPQGRKGPAFMVYPNFQVLFEWNRSLVYVTTAAYFATRIEGAPVFDPGAPDPSLSPEEVRALQQKLVARGHDVGGVDGILGAMTRPAVQREQARLGLPADGWPTRALLNGF
ncbi:MAG: lytic murein transglycosylase [Gemmobacter sp.]